MIEERFWAKVAKARGCWLWQGAVGGDGYGRFKAGSRYVRPHRFAVELSDRPIGKGLVVRHRCDTPLCVNPKHLEVGTQKENIADMMARGRHVRRAPTHCKNGHLFTRKTTLVDKRGWRCCAICKADSQRRRMGDPIKHARQLSLQRAWRERRRVAQ